MKMIEVKLLDLNGNGCYYGSIPEFSEPAEVLVYEDQVFKFKEHGFETENGITSSLLIYQQIQHYKIY